MAFSQSYPSIQANDGFVITFSDTDDITEDANNTNGYKHCFIHNKGVGAAVKITTARGTDLTIYINQGATCEMAVKRIWSTGTDAVAGDLIAFVGN